MYGLKQTLRAWYDGLRNCMLENHFTKGQTYTTLFRKSSKSELIIFKTYVVDIIFNYTNEKNCQ